MLRQVTALAVKIRVALYLPAKTPQCTLYREPPLKVASVDREINESRLRSVVAIGCQDEACI
jgi:hypothetical protein